jgi:hypothetical protein
MFLNQEWYAKEIKAESPATDYRWYWKKSFDVLFAEVQGGHHLGVLLRKA